MEEEIVAKYRYINWTYFSKQVLFQLQELHKLYLGSERLYSHPLHPSPARLNLCFAKEPGSHRDFCMSEML